MPTSGSRLPRRLSLKRRNDIEPLFARGRRVQSGLLTIRWQQEAAFRFGVFLRAGGATAPQRNRIKRLLREAIRLNRQKLRAPVHIAVLLAGKTDKPSFHVLDAQIKELFDRINVALPE